MENRTYQETLCLYYEEEIEGEAYFAELARAFDTPEHTEKLLLLAEVERVAAASVAPLIAKHGLTPRPVEDLTASGRAEAQQTIVDWDALLAEMNETYPGYLRAFEGLEAMGPVEDQPRLAILTRHEAAALEFLALEPHAPQRSAAPLRAYIADGSAPQDQAVLA